MNTHRPPEELALDLRDKSPCVVKVAAVLIDNRGRVISWGWNHTVEYGFRHAGKGMGKHAEKHAFERANPRRFRGSILIVTAKRSNGQWHDASPCENCGRLARKHGIRIIKYTDRAGNWVVLKRQYGVHYVRVR